MVVAQSPISNNAQSARWYRKAVRASVMEIYSRSENMEGGFFSSSPTLSLLFCCMSLVLSLGVSVHLFVTLLSVWELRFPYLKLCQSNLLHLTQRIGLTKLYCPFQAAETAAAPTIVAISIPVVIISVLRISEHLCVIGLIHYLCMFVF